MVHVHCGGICASKFVTFDGTFMRVNLLLLNEQMWEAGSNEKLHRVNSLLLNVARYQKNEKLGKKN